MIIKKIDAEKVEKLLVEIYSLFEQNNVTGNEGAAIGGQILANASAGMTVLRLQSQKF